MAYAYHLTHNLRQERNLPITRNINTIITASITVGPTEQQ